MHLVTCQGRQCAGQHSPWMLKEERSSFSSAFANSLLVGNSSQCGVALLVHFYNANKCWYLGSRNGASPAAYRMLVVNYAVSLAIF